MTHLLQVLMEAADLAASTEGVVWGRGLADCPGAQHRGQHVCSRACIMMMTTH